MTTRQMFSIVLSSIIFKHPISVKALVGAILVFGVLFWQIRRKYRAKGAIRATHVTKEEPKDLEAPKEESVVERKE